MVVPADREPDMTRLRRLRALLWDAFRVLRWDDEAPAFRLVRQAWQGGPLARVGLGALVLGTLVSGALIGIARPTGAELAPALVASTLVLLAIATALGLAVATTLPLSLYVMIALPVGWYGLLPAGGTAGTPLFALPALALLGLGVVTARLDPIRGLTRARLWLLPLALGAGWVSRGGFHLAFRDTPALDTVAGLTLGLALWAVSTQRRLLERRSAPSLSARALTLFAVLALTWSVSACSEPGATAERLVLVARALLLPTALFWLWLGGTAFQGVLIIGAWVARTFERLLGRRAIALGLPTLWVLGALFAWLATWPLPLWAARLAHTTGLTGWSADLDAPTWFALRALVIVSAIALALLLALAARARLRAQSAPSGPPPTSPTHSPVLLVHGLWCASFLGVLALWEAAEDAVAGADDGLRLSAWAGVLLVGGLVWEIARSGGEWAVGPPARVIGLLAGLVAFVGITGAVIGAGLPDLLVEYAFYGLLGVVVLGVPLALRDLLVPEADDAPSLSGPRTAGLSLSGAAIAFFILGLDPWAGPSLALAPPVWAAIVLSLRSRFGLADRRMAATAGAALGVGFAIYWLSPEALALPLLDLWQARWLTVDLGRPVLDLGAFALPLLCLVLGLGLGLAVADGRRLLVALAVALATPALPVLATRLPDLPTGPPVRRIAAPAPPAPEGAPVPGWSTTPLGDGLVIDLPPDWRELALPGLDFNRSAPDGSALLSALLLPMDASPDKLVEASEVAAEGWRAIAPDRRELGLWPQLLGPTLMLRADWTSARARGVDLFILLPDGLLRLSLLADPDAAERHVPSLLRAAASLRRRPDEPPLP